MHSMVSALLQQLENGFDGVYKKSDIPDLVATMPP